ncbi:hypothetical protein FRX31_002549 [Thalictrum thalictroides]|uniref:Uncharacterized protein n=1 Tax=Thalictrum thalictroides TaxID=46969 RepID=A0A7J6XE75_THATH|nr:hypothetical protein FRX31_002549 [Thalictrum thalictroides]
MNKVKSITKNEVVLDLKEHNKNSLHRRQQNRGPAVTTRATDEVIEDLSPQRSPGTLASSNPGPRSSISPPVLSGPRNPNPFMVSFSSPPVYVVPNSQSKLLS